MYILYRKPFSDDRGRVTDAGRRREEKKNGPKKAGPARVSYVRLWFRWRRCEEQLQEWPRLRRRDGRAIVWFVYLFGLFMSWPEQRVSPPIYNIIKARYAVVFLSVSLAHSLLPNFIDKLFVAYVRSPRAAEISRRYTRTFVHICITIIINYIETRAYPYPLLSSGRNVLGSWTRPEKTDTGPE